MNFDAEDIRKCIENVIERAARKILIRENLVKLEELAFMTRYDVCEKLLEHNYEVVVRDENDNVTIVKHENADKYKSIIMFLTN